MDEQTYNVLWHFSEKLVAGYNATEIMRPIGVTRPQFLKAKQAVSFLPKKGTQMGPKLLSLTGVPNIFLLLISSQVDRANTGAK